MSLCFHLTRAGRQQNTNTFRKLGRPVPTSASGTLLTPTTRGSVASTGRDAPVATGESSRSCLHEYSSRVERPVPGVKQPLRASDHQ